MAETKTSWDQLDPHQQAAWLLLEDKLRTLRDVMSRQTYHSAEAGQTHLRNFDLVLLLVDTLKHWHAWTVVNNNEGTETIMDMESFLDIHGLYDAYYDWDHVLPSWEEAKRLGMRHYGDVESGAGRAPWDGPHDVNGDRLPRPTNGEASRG
jgi:hypothetical protein